MRFKVQYMVKDFRVPCKLQFSFDRDGSNVEITLQPIQTQDVQDPLNKSSYCEVAREVTISSEIDNILQQYQNHEIDDLSNYTGPIDQFIQHELLKNFKKYAIELLHCLRWRAGLKKIYTLEETNCWLLNNNKLPEWIEIKYFYVLPVRILDFSIAPGFHKLKPDSVSAFTNEVSAAFGKKLIEPIHHRIFHEAWEQRDRQPATAIIFANTAIEIALKQCYTQLKIYTETTLHDKICKSVNFYLYWWLGITISTTL